MEAREKGKLYQLDIERKIIKRRKHRERKPRTGKNNDGKRHTPVLLLQKRTQVKFK